METVPKPGSNVPPKKDRLQAKKKVGISLGWKGSFYLRGSRGGGRRAAEYEGSCSAGRNRGDTGSKRPLGQRPELLQVPLINGRGVESSAPRSQREMTPQRSFGSPRSPEN